MAQHPSTPALDAQLDALNWGHFPRYRDQIEQCFQAMQGMQQDPDRAIEKAATCLEAIWARYIDDETAKIFGAFASVQKALFGLELEEGSAHRYREHVLHMFNVYILGAWMLSPLATVDDDEARDAVLRRVVKIVPEREEIGDWGEWTPYDAQKRLFYLWTLMSTFHDIGIPVQHLATMRDGLIRYLDYFGRDLAELLTHLEPAVTSQLQYYFGLMASLFNTRVELDNTRSGLYLRGKVHPYLYKTLADALGGVDPDHGVVSALCLYRSLERAFMKDREHHDLSLEHFPAYVDLVLEQDVTRAALGIAFHNLKPATYPKLFPVSFADFPLTYILLLTDDLQEFFRLEGVTYRGVVPLSNVPSGTVMFDGTRLDVKLHYLYSHPGQPTWQAMRSSAEAFAKENNLAEQSYSSHEEFVKALWSRLIRTLRGKLKFGPDQGFHLCLEVWYQEESANRQLLDTWDTDALPTSS